MQRGRGGALSLEIQPGGGSSGLENPVRKGKGENSCHSSGVFYLFFWNYLFFFQYCLTCKPTTVLFRTTLTQTITQYKLLILLKKLVVKLVLLVSRKKKNALGLFTISFPEATILLVRRRRSQPLARSNTRSPRFTDFPSLCTCPESNLTNLIGSGLNLLCLQSHSKPECCWTWPGVPISSA